MPIDAAFVVSDLEDGKVIRNAVRVSWRQHSVTLLHGGGEQGLAEKQGTLRLFDELIKSKGSGSIRVRVVGSEQTNAQSLDKHTLYIIEFQEGGSKELLFKRFSEL
jgi:hypothetical protein